MAPFLEPLQVTAVSVALGVSILGSLMPMESTVKHPAWSVTEIV